MKKDYDIALRGHHLLSLYAYLILGEVEARTALVEGHKYSRKHAKRTIRMFEKIINSNIRVKIMDALDDICKKCDKDRKKSGKCMEDTPFISREVGQDRKIAHWYGFRINEIYSSENILKIIKEKDLVDLVDLVRMLSSGFILRAGGD